MLILEQAVFAQPCFNFMNEFFCRQDHHLGLFLINLQIEFIKDNPKICLWFHCLYFIVTQLAVLPDRSPRFHGGLMDASGVLVNQQRRPAEKLWLFSSGIVGD
jgi:hypothetical protein